MAGTEMGPLESARLETTIPAQDLERDSEGNLIGIAQQVDDASDPGR